MTSVEGMDVEIVRALMREELSTADLMRVAAKRLDVSLATLYRYKADPAQIPFGKLIQLGRHLAFPIGGHVLWSKEEVLVGERRRYENESEIAKTYGSRQSVTPSYPVTAELPELTQFLWMADYDTRYLDQRDEYLAIRAARRKLYVEGRYKSIELIYAHAYRDFFNGKGRFRGIPERLRDAQVCELLATNTLPNITRRIYTHATPELPVITSYSNTRAYIRADDLVVEFRDSAAVGEIEDIFRNYFERSAFLHQQDVQAFLENPNRRKP